jgi:hypothetical protein
MSTQVQLLQSALTEYKKAEAELTAYRQKADKSEREAQSAIDNHEISEGVASTKLALSQVLSARVKSREAELNKSLVELGKVTTLASERLNDLVREAWLKRRLVVGKRAIEAMQVPDKLLDQGVLDEAFGFSAPLLAVKEFGVAVYASRYTETYTQKPIQMVTVNVGDREVLEELTTDREPTISQTLDVDHLVQVSEQIIAKFEGLSDEMKREI